MALSSSQSLTFSVGETARRVGRKLPLLALEMVCALAIYSLYIVGRGLPPERIAKSTVNAVLIIDMEQALGIFWEPALQKWALQYDGLISAANFTYLQLHLPLVMAASAIFFLTDMRKQRVLRNAMLLSGFLAMCFYWFAPVTPPRLLPAGLDHGMIDTIGTSRTKPGGLGNNYAAIPSYHFGWILLVVYGTWWCYRSWILRTASVLFITWMTYCIVVTGNHFFFDMALGGVMVTLAFMLTLRWERATEQYPELTRFFFKKDGLRLPF
jgi:hypothetical protein